MTFSLKDYLAEFDKEMGAQREKTDALAMQMNALQREYTLRLETLDKMMKAREKIAASPHLTRTVPVPLNTTVVVYSEQVQGDNGTYEVYVHLVNDEYFVFSCSCPKFRYSKGVIADGKRCKHIDRYIVNKSRAQFEADCRQIACRYFYSKSKAAKFLSLYRFDFFAPS